MSDNGRIISISRLFSDDIFLFFNIVLLLKSGCLNFINERPNDFGRLIALNIISVAIIYLKNVSAY